MVAAPLYIKWLVNPPEKLLDFSASTSDYPLIKYLGVFSLEELCPPLPRLLGVNIQEKQVSVAQVNSLLD